MPAGTHFTGPLFVGGAQIFPGFPNILGGGGNSFFVDAVTGLDSNPGTAQLPLQSIQAAYNLTVDGNGDKVILMTGQMNVTGVVTATSSTTSVVATNLTYPAGLSAINWAMVVGCTMVQTSGSYANQAAVITNYVPSTGTFTVATFGNAPAIGTTFTIYAVNISDYFIWPSTWTGTTPTATSTFTWAKNNTHLIGDCPPTMYNPAVRIRGYYNSGTAANTVTSMLTVTGNGCYLGNFTMYDDLATAATASAPLVMNGSANVMFNVNVQGMMGTASTGGAAAAGSRDMILSGSNNSFYNCVFGGSPYSAGTAVRRGAVANANIEFLVQGSGAAQGPAYNTFDGCHLVCYASNAAPLFLYGAAAASLQGWTIFRNGVFDNIIAPFNGTAGTTLTKAMTLAGSTQGQILLQNNPIIGCTGVSGGSGVVYTADAVPTAATSALAVVQST